MRQQLTPDFEKPQAEPEIYPPGTTIPRERIWTSTGARGTQRIYVARVGPFGLTLLALATGALSMLALFLLVGAALIFLAVGGVLAVGAVIGTISHGRSRRQ